jgi:hypothetical protein
MPVKYLGDLRYIGLSGDTKPTPANTAVGAAFEETDTRKEYINSGTEWIPQDFQAILRYEVKKIGSTYYATDERDKKEQSGSDLKAAIQPIIDAMALGTTVHFVLDSDLFVIDNPITLPIVADNTVKQIIIEGEWLQDRQTTAGGCTTIQPSATFPNNSYVFEGSAGIGSNNVVAGLVLRNLSIPNNLHATDGVNVGFLKYENDSKRNHKLFVERVYTQYMWRGIHLIGGVWWAKFLDMFMQEANASFVGDAFIILEDGGHSNANNPSPKECTFQRISLTNGSGKFTDAIRITAGGYNRFNEIDVNGRQYTNAIINMNNTDALTIHNNTFDNFQVIDTNVTPTPDNRKATLYLAGTAVNDNIFKKMRLVNYPIAILMEGTGVRHNLIEAAAHFGAILQVTDTTASAFNTVVVQGGSTTGVANKITHTGGLSRIIDTRRGAVNGGTSTQSSNGTTTIFNIAHGLFASPEWRWVTPTSDDAVGPFKVTSDATNITVTYPLPPASGSSNLVWNWRAGVYI